MAAGTTGFATFSLGDFTTAGLLTVSLLMFIGASPGSTGGGIKTSTLFTLFHTIKGAAINRQPQAFHYKIPQEAFYKAAMATALSASGMYGNVFDVYSGAWDSI